MNKLGKAKAHWWLWYFFGVLTMPIEALLLVGILALRRCIGKRGIERKLTRIGVRKGLWYLRRFDEIELDIEAQQEGEKFTGTIDEVRVHGPMTAEQVRSRLAAHEAMEHPHEEGG